MDARTWVAVPEGSPFPLENLPYGVCAPPGGPPRPCVRIGDHVLDLAPVAADLPFAPALAGPSLDAFMALGPDVWRRMRARVVDVLTDPAARARFEPHLLAVERVAVHLPFAVADLVDFYASEHHASNVGRILRPGQEPLPANWRSLPIGYHGRAGTVVVSGTPVVRPCGQRVETPGEPPVFGPTRRLDLEAEVGFVVGVPSRHGEPVPLSAFADHVFGVCLVNDWSARDIQAWEYVPLGPFLGKSFATSVSPWIVPLEALAAARVPPPPRDPLPLPYLDDRDHPWGLDLTLEVRLNDEVVSRPPFATMYWTAAQQLAHLTVNGASVRTGDLYASGTVSGAEPGTWGSLLELTRGGREPLRLADGRARAFLEDGDEVTISATAPGAGGTTIGFGEVSGRVLPARA